MTRREINPIPIQSWFARRGNIVLLIAALFLLISAFTYFLCSRHYQQVKEHTLQDDRNIASLCAMLVEVHLHDIISSMESYANRPLLIRAVADKNTDKAREHLLNLIRINPAIDSVIITGPDGTAWISQPHRPELMGKNFAYRDWYRGVSRRWTPYVSQAEKRLAGEKDTAIYIAVPVLDDKGRPIGILVNTERVIEIGNLLKRTPLVRNASLSIIDPAGSLIYSSRHPYDKALIRCSFFEAFKSFNAGGGHVQTFLTADLHAQGALHHVSFAPLKDVGWHVLIGRGKDTIMAETASYITQTATIAALLFLIAIGFILYLRRRVILQTLEDRLRAKKELLVSESRFRELFDHMSSGVAIYEAVNDGEDFIFSDMNNAGQRITGVSEGFAGKSVREVFPGVDAFGLFRIFQQVWKTGEAMSHPMSIYSDQHLTFWAENYVSKLPSGHIVAVFDDITERKRAESERFRLMDIIDNSFNEIYVFDTETLLFEYANQGALKNIGYTLEEITQLTPVDIKPLLSTDIFRDMLRPLITGEKEQLVFETVHRRKDGTVYPVEVHVQLYKQLGKNVFYAVINDITERKAGEDKIKRINEELEERVAQRTRELAAKNIELERLNRVFVDRELKMRELKAKIAEMEKDA